MTISEELFSQITEILSTEPEIQNRLMYQTLATACREALKDSKYGFGNLASQVDRLCRDQRINPNDTAAINNMRRHSYSMARILPDDLLFDCRALAIFISAIFNEDIPADLLQKIPAVGRQTTARQKIDHKYIRCVVRSWDNHTISVAVISNDNRNQLLTVDYSDTPDYIDHSYLRRILCEGMQLNLLDCRTKRRRIIPRMIVVEPDYLLDISAIANCFEEYGHHPLLFTVKRFSERPNNKYTLLGNFAGAALDDIINHPNNYDITNTFRANFRKKVLDFAACTDFSSEEFKQECVRQARNIEAITEELFSEFSREKALLEPSFVCEKLGIQGRVDLMTTDFKLLVEQKSGKNLFIERKQGNHYGSLHIEKHYVQLLLYFGILQYNFGVSAKKAHIRLLYSKYPLPSGLLDVSPLRKLLAEAIKFRNTTVATEYWIAQNGFEGVIDRLTPENLNVNGLNSTFYHRYLLPQLNKILNPLHQMPETERAYLSRMITFVMKEQLISKVGAREGVSSCHADLWNMPLSEKIETGNIFTGLTIADKQASTEFSGFDIITLDIQPQQTQNFLPNFRRGDMIYLYAYEPKNEPDVRKSILFKGTLQEIIPERIIIKLNDGQQNADLISGDCFAIEHASSDISGTTALRGLYTFITTPAERRKLLFGMREPQADNNVQLSKTYSADYDNIILRARQSKDYFLLIGPPGTGKTSQALQFLVSEHLDGNILLMAYTNRAVDEICVMLSTSGFDYIRLGNPLSCDPQFAPHLISEIVEKQPNLSAIKHLIADTRIIVGTTSTVGARDYLFKIKHFDLAIVDEASQILEPNIIGLLAAHQDGECRIRKFILIGDYKQLPAVVQQSTAEAQVNNSLLNGIHLTNCADSLFERLIRIERAAGREQFIGTLRKQGRMHPDIAQFPSAHFYANEQLRPVPLAHQTESNISHMQPATSELDRFLTVHRMIFIPSRNCRQPNLSDKVNVHEADITALVLSKVHRMLGADFSPQSVGVIVPYRNQIAMIRKAIHKLQIPELLDITIDTVERYQGSQRDIIIYSFTVQRTYQLDFLTANTFVENGQIIDRKLNVAITRARRQLIMTGNEQTLQQSEIFAKLIDSTRQSGGYLDAEALPLPPKYFNSEKK